MNSIANLRRPSFLSGSVVINEKPQVKALNKAIFRRFQNNDIARPSFKQKAPRARHGISEDRLRMIDISEHGTKVQLSEKALEKLSVMVKDETDKAWLKEEARRLDLGETIADLINKPPLGRPQRQREARVDIGSNLLPLGQNLTLIESALANEDYLEKPEDLEGIIYNVIDNEYRNKKNISKTNFNRIKKITKKLRFRGKLFDKQVDLTVFNKSPAQVIMYLLTRPNTIVENALIDQDDNSPVSLVQLLSIVRQGRVVDLETGSVLPSGRRIIKSVSSSDEGETKSQSSSSSSSPLRKSTSSTDLTF